MTTAVNAIGHMTNGKRVKDRRIPIQYYVKIFIDQKFWALNTRRYHQSRNDVAVAI